MTRQWCRDYASYGIKGTQESRESRQTSFLNSALTRDTIMERNSTENL